jgi:ferric-dicitrate binding protein FerR (iron transport regulator)
VWAPLGIAGIILAISAPSMLLASMKLRRRNLGPLLDANGWAINALTRINVPFGTALTERAAPPPNAERSLADPYAEKRRPWKLYLALLAIAALAVAWYLGKLDDYLPDKLTSTTVLGEHAPGATAPAK